MNISDNQAREATITMLKIIQNSDIVTVRENVFSSQFRFTNNESDVGGALINILEKYSFIGVVIPINSIP